MPGADDALQAGGPDRSSSAEDPRTVSGYRLLRRVGEGGMSRVYLSYDVPARRAVAVKLLADHLASQQEFVNRFYREARLSRLLRHPNIVQGYAAGFDPDTGKHYLVLEFIDGPSAQTALARLGRLPIGVAVKIAADIARGLDHLHAKNYIHRDVKPDNILLHPEGVAKLADLGLTKRLNDDTQLTSVNQGVGTSYYMPYEQALNATLVDGRSDVFALGATLYHLLTGEVPFPGATHEEIVRGKEHNEFRPPSAINPEIPAALDEIVAATLARDPRARFQRAAALAAALDATRLATRIPSFASAGSPTAPETVPEHDSLPTARTRADLPPPLTCPPEPPLLRPPTVPPGGQPTAQFTATPPPKPGGNRLTPFFLFVLLLGAGVLGLFARSNGKPAPVPAPALPPVTVVHDCHPAGRCGLPTCDPQ